MAKPTETVRHRFCNGKYEYVRRPDFRAHVYRHGEEWRDVTGDGLILAMAQRVEELEEALTKLEAAARQLMGDELGKALTELEVEARGITDEETKKALAELNEEGRKAVAAISGEDA